MIIVCRVSKVYLICDNRVKDPVRFREHEHLSDVAMARWGGRFLVRGGAVTPLLGNWRPERVVVAEFGDMQAARRWYDSKERRTASLVRQEFADMAYIFVEGV